MILAHLALLWGMLYGPGCSHPPNCGSYIGDILRRPQLYVVCWQYYGYIGNGEPLDKEIAQAWADEKNRNYPNIKHWIEPASPFTNCLENGSDK